MMSEESRSEVLTKKVQRYQGRGRLGRSRLLDEVCELCGYERKYAIKLLGGKTPISGSGRRRGGPRPRYGEAEAVVVKTIWLSAEQPCGKRLKATVPLWLADYEREQGPLEAELRERVLQMSAATLDRLLAPARISLGSRGGVRDAPRDFVAQTDSHPHRA